MSPKKNNPDLYRGQSKQHDFTFSNAYANLKESVKKLTSPEKIRMNIFKGKSILRRGGKKNKTHRKTRRNKK